MFRKAPQGRLATSFLVAGSTIPGPRTQAMFRADVVEFFGPL